MKKYHVYGMGNALVDMEIEVTPEFLQEMSVDKGLMTLVDQNRQSQLLEAVGGGQHKRSCGGSAANTIIAISQLGGRSFYSCKVANDEPGDFYFKNLIESNVDTNLHGTRDGGTTGKCMVFVTPDADRTMNTFLGITAEFSEKELKYEDIADSEYLYIEGYLVTGENSLNAAVKARNFARENNVKVALTLSDPGIVAHFNEAFKTIIGENNIDLLFCNEDEAMSFTGESTVDAAAESLKNYSHQFAITKGENGALVFDGEKYIEIIAPKVKPVDSNGAGDLFAGAFLYAITNGHSFSEAGKLACHCSSDLVTKFGPRLEFKRPKEIYSEVFSS